VVFHLRSSRKYKDSVKIIKNERKKNSLKESEDFIFDKKQQENINKSRKSSNDGLLMRHRKIQYIPHSKTTWHKPSHMNKGNLIFDKPNYNRVLFNVNFVKYFGKEEKVLEITNNGIFSIYNRKGKVYLFYP
jgi:hypothetical protein